ncbi:MAG: hypothetical protein KF838_09430 [Phycisphaeraceae bacterium]|nr:MAG: hypothetical protein KF838_09430 [Phycisphaeraceae bacterium]
MSPMSHSEIDLMGFEAERVRRRGLGFYGSLSLAVGGIALMICALGIVVVRTYVAAGERFADLSGPEPDASPSGVIGIALGIAQGQGIHRPFGLAGAVLLIFGIFTAVCDAMLARWRRRTLARSMASIADEVRRVKREKTGE